MTGLRVLPAKHDTWDDLPNYWEVDAPVKGLEDIARGWWPPAHPETFYLLRNRDRSGVMGIITPNGDVVNRSASTTGQHCEVRDDEGNIYDGEVMWDGAQPSPVSGVPLGWHDVEEIKPIFQESSKGILLGDYSNNGELWNSIHIGRAMV